VKENSIEEDIEIVESIIEEYENCSVPEIDMQVNVTFREKQNNALNHILSDYKRVLKENEELKRLHIQDNKHLDFIMEHSIPVQKVKDRIEKLKKNLYTVEHYETVGAINVLQELLEGRK